MTKQRLNFTKDAIEALPLPMKGRDVYYDAQQRYLCLMVADGGAKTFYVVRTVEGRQRRFAFARAGDVSLPEARDRAGKYAAALAEGKTREEILNKPKINRTLHEVWKEYLIYLKGHKKSADYYEGIYKLHLEKKALSRYLLTQIKQTDIQRVHDEVSVIGKIMANRVLGLLCALFNRAIRSGYLPPMSENPAAKILKHRERSRQRYLSGDELPLLWAALDKVPQHTHDFIKLSLFTGARKKNVLSMRWADINFTGQRWCIPDTKNGESVTVPLVMQAMEILNRRKETAKGEYVFPTSRPSMKTPYWCEARNAWVTLLKVAGFINKDGKWLRERLTIHDLRHTCGSWMAASGASLVMVGKLLGHKSPRSTQLYAHMDLDPVREVLSQMADAMAKACKPAE